MHLVSSLPPLSRIPAIFSRVLKAPCAAAFGSEVACVNPRQGWLSRSLNISGRRPVVFRASEGFIDQPRLVPCGDCPACRATRSGEMATRGFLELLDYPAGNSCMLNLTYDDEHLPHGGTLVSQDLAKFWKRLRERLGVELRYLACGEYGDLTNRPHYHALVFGWRPTDLKIYDSSVSTSAFLSKVWTAGQPTVGSATQASAAYVAGYVAKKLRSSSYPPGVLPPFIRCSSKPALGSRWIRNHYEELSRDELYIGPGRVVPVPKHLLILMEDEAPRIYQAIKALRRKRAAVSGSNLNRPGYSSIEANILARRKSRDAF